MNTSFVHIFYLKNQDLLVSYSIDQKILIKIIFSIQFKQSIQRGNQYDAIENRNYVHL